MTMRFAYLASGEGRLLQTTINALAQHALPFTLAAVVADRPCGAVERARRAGIPAHVADRKAHASQQSWETALLAVCADAGAEALILNFDRLLSPAFLQRYPRRVLNTHFSLLPLFKGFGALRQAADSGMRFAGVTVHLVDETMDGGPIVAQAVAPAAPGDAAALGRRLFDLAVPLQLQAMSWLAQGRLRVSGGRVEVAGARFEGLPFSPALEAPLDALSPALYAQVAYD